MNYLIENVILYKTYLILGIAVGVLAKPFWKHLLKPFLIFVLAAIYGLLHWAHSQDDNRNLYQLSDDLYKFRDEFRGGLERLKIELLLNEKLKNDPDRKVLEQCYIQTMHGPMPGERIRSELFKPGHEPKTLNLFQARWYVGDKTDKPDLDRSIKIFCKDE